MIPIERQIACATRELALRRQMYPLWVQAGRMKQTKADEELAAMEAVLETLRAVQQGGEDVAQEPARE